MSEEIDLPEITERENAEPARFDEDHYDRLMDGQEPWLDFRQAWRGEGDPWEAFKEDNKDEAITIRTAIALWNDDPPQPALLEGASLMRAHLDGVTLVGAHLEGATLIEAHLKGAILRRAHMERATLIDAHMEGADLLSADLRGAILSRTHLDGAHVLSCRLEVAYLANADLTNVTGLTAGQLAGADVTSAQLPEDIKNFESIKVADEAAKNSRSLFLVMLLACVYSWLTLSTTTDAALILNTGSSPLPIIRVPVPIVGFYLAAPAFLLAVYVYFHLYLHGLWTLLSRLPAVFPDGRPLDQRAYPWLLTSLVRPHFERLREDKPALSGAKVRLSILLAWWVVPFTIYLFWAQALAAHVWYMTAIHLAFFLASLGVGVVTYRIAVSALRLVVAGMSGWRNVVRQVASAGGGRVPIGAAIVVLASALALWGLRRLPSAPLLFAPYADLTDAQLSTRTKPAFEGDSIKVVPARLTGRNLRFATLVRANLEEAVLDSADLSWANLLLAVLDSADLRGADLSGAVLDSADLRGADLSGAVLDSADLRGADLSGANLLWADLSGAELRGAELRWANLFGADLTEADLFGADLTEADLGGAQLSGASLLWADLPGANLGGANLSGADLTQAKLRGAELRWANLFGADLTSADLGGADLTGADLTSADLGGADLTGADLGGADLTGADLGGAQLSGANLTGADLRRAQLSEASLFSNANLEETNVAGVRNPPSGFWQLAATAGATCRDPSTGERTAVSELLELWDGEGAPPGCGPMRSVGRASRIDTFDPGSRPIFDSIMPPSG